MAPGLLLMGALAFAAEIVLFVAIGIAGWVLWEGILGLFVAAVCIVALVVVWALWLAPRSPRRLSFGPRLALATVLYAIPVLLLVGEPEWHVWVGLVAVAWLVYLVTAFPLRRADGAEL
jgi:hypothetical protein